MAAVTVAAMLGLTACGSSSTPSDAAAKATPEKAPLTLYNAQHEDLMALMVADFTKQTGIKVKMRNGEDFELGNQLVQEGAASPADVFVTENSPAMTLVNSKGLFSKVNATALGQVPRSSPPATRTGWVSPPGRPCSPTTRPS